jgi:uncharacterized repeat protein (TIGR01451 family)
MLKKFLLIISVLFFSFSLNANVQGQTFSVDLEAIPPSGCSPLNDVDFKATVFGGYSGYVTYFFDCTNDGNWDTIASKNSDNYQALNVCDYSAVGNYTAKVRVENQGSSSEDTAQINVYTCGSSPKVDILANNSDGPITIGYNSSALLTWNSNNANNCSGSGGWSGSKAIAYGSESTGNLTSSKYYTITCLGNGGNTVSDSVWVNVSSDYNYNSGSIFAEKLARNLSDGGFFANSIYADPGELISFSIRVRADNSGLSNVIVKDTLPDKLIYQSNSLQIDGVSSSGNIFSGLNIGNFYSGQEKTITFSALVAGKEKFGFGQTQLVNTVLISSSNNSNSKSATVIVNKTSVAGAATEVSTGITNNLFLDSFFLPLSLALAVVWFLKSYIVRIQDWFYLKRRKYQEYNSGKLLQIKIAGIKAKEFLRKK